LRFLYFAQKFLCFLLTFLNLYGNIYPKHREEVAKMKDEMKVARTADRLREAMTAAGKTQADLMRETELNRSAISRYLSGDYEPKQRAVAKLAVALDVSEMWLWGYDVPRERTAAQKKNDDLVQVVAKLRNDPDFYEVVSILARLQPAEYTSIKQILLALGNK
jgi:transcriptional regulator with XRE-family HTH domain